MTRIPVVQMNTGGCCHLDAPMIRAALAHLKYERGVRIVNPDVAVFRVWCQTGAGRDEWGEWLGLRLAG